MRRRTLSSIYRRRRSFLSENTGYHDRKYGDIVLLTNSNDQKHGKAVGFVSYGSAMGARGVQQLRLTACR